MDGTAPSVLLGCRIDRTNVAIQARSFVLVKTTKVIIVNKILNVCDQDKTKSIYIDPILSFSN